MSDEPSPSHGFLNTLTYYPNTFPSADAGAVFQMAISENSDPSITSSIPPSHGNRYSSRSSTTIPSIQSENLFTKIPRDMTRYYEPLTTEDYDVTDSHHKQNIEENQMQSDVVQRLTWDDSLDSSNFELSSDSIRTDRDREARRIVQDNIRQINLEKAQQEERSKRRRIERLQHIVDQTKSRIVQDREPSPSSSHPIVNHEHFSREETERELQDVIKNLRTIANRCLKAPDQGGREILKRLQKDTTKIVDDLSTVVGSSQNECFMCLFGNREFDKSTADKTNGLYRILGNLLYKDVTIRAIAAEMYAYYLSEIYYPGIKSGLMLPRWSSEGIERHIRSHIWDPRVKSFLRLEQISLAKEVLSTQITYYDEEDGITKINYVAMRLLQSFIKLEDDLQKRDYRTMMGYDESINLNPGQAWINTRINVTNKKKV